MKSVVDVPSEVQELACPVPSTFPIPNRAKDPKTTTANNAHDRPRYRSRGRAEYFELFRGTAGLSLVLSHRVFSTSAFDTDIGGVKPPLMSIVAGLGCCSVLAARFIYMLELIVQPKVLLG